METHPNRNRTGSMPFDLFSKFSRTIFPIDDYISSRFNVAIPKLAKILSAATPNIACIDSSEVFGKLSELL